MSVEFRQAGAADLAALVAAFGDEGSFQESFDGQQDKRGLLLVGWLGRDPVAHVYLRMEPADEQELRDRLPAVPLLNRVEVLPAHRNRGIGTEVMAEAERLLVEHGHDEVALAVTLDNRDAARLYTRLGYRYWEHGEIKCANRDGTLERCHVMVKELADSSASDPARPAPSARRTGAA